MFIAYIIVIVDHHG